MSTTPICDFVRRYAESGAARLHMPGHKGVPFLGCEALDITEIDGADSLYVPHGIIRESERNASRLFGCDTYYSAEGSSLCVRAMLYLACLYTGKKAVLAARNVHTSFLSAAALLDLDVHWLHPQPGEGYQTCTVSPAALGQALRETPVGAVYITSPDYPGNLADIAPLADVCHRNGALLLVDNAHGAYLRFLSPSRHPADLGADLCCDSAHKTLPVLTGGAYLHVSDALSDALSPHVKAAMALFGSTSPSYLILQSLDLANEYLETFPQMLSAFCEKADALRQKLTAHGFTLCGTEPLKITVRARLYGYTGDQLSNCLLQRGVVCEMHDADLLTVMLTPQNTDEALARFADALCAVQRRPALPEDAPPYRKVRSVCSVREALFAPRETLPVERCVGRILAQYDVHCPPAVPTVLCGERLDEAAVRALAWYGVTACTVLREDGTRATC